MAFSRGAFEKMKSQTIMRSIFAMALALGLYACAGAMPPPGTAAYEATQYRLGAGDRVKITVFGEDELSKEYIVSSAGDVSFPLIGDVSVIGKSVSELQIELVAILAQGYLNDPRVNVEVLNYRPFYILGEVTKAGEYPYSDGLTVFQAVALAGGFSYRADQRQIFVRRAGLGNEETYDLRTSRPVYVAPGDTIRVGERYF